MLLAQQAAASTVLPPVHPERDQLQHPPAALGAIRALFIILAGSDARPACTRNVRRLADRALQAGMRGGCCCISSNSC
jgi:hypothetical protein